MAERRDRSGAWLGWVETGNGLVNDVLGGLDDAALAAASALPGWDRRTVLAHLVGNARSHLRLMTWARTGVETPAYASAEAREAEIAEIAAQPDAQLRTSWLSSARDWSETFDALTSEQLEARLVARGGAKLRARQVAWLRAREVMVHVVDLRGSVGWDALPEDFLRALIDNVVRDRSRKALDPAMELRAGDETWTIDGTGEPSEITSTLPALAAYLTGRPTPESAMLAPLTPWL